MKDYSDFLIVSDVDGTLNNKLRRTPKVNIRAIDSFIHTYRGKFTLASARSVASLRPHYMNLPSVKTPAIILNGAGIYDYIKEEMIWFNPIEKSAIDIIKSTMEKFSHIEIGVFSEDMIYIVRPRIFSYIMMMVDRLPHKAVKTIDEVPFKNWGKVIFFVVPTMKEKVMTYVSSLVGDSHKLIDTAMFSFDLVNKTTDKGNAIHALAEIIDIPKENIAAIGDYYNDYDMLKKVAHPATAGQAPEDLKNLAEFVACHCNEGAVADLIEYVLEKY